MVYFVLYQDGTWAGGFERRTKAELLAAKHDGQVVEGRCFNTHGQETIVSDPYAQCYHPSGFIAEELVARNWTPDMLIDAMMQHYPESRTKLEMVVYMYFEVGPTTKSMRLGETLIDLLHRVFGTSREFWAGLEQSWIDDPTQPFAE